MSNVLTSANLSRYWVPEQAWGHALVLGPMLALHEALRLKRLEGYQAAPFKWEWSERRAIDETLAVIWNMTGRWKARRAVTVQRESFDTVTSNVVPRLSSFLNKEGVVSLWDLAQADDQKYSRVVARLHHAVMHISRVRTTVQTEPVLGSKVLHHFFPSIIPVFDTALVRNGVMRTRAFQALLVASHDWLIYRTADEASGHSMLDFHRYFAVCAQFGSRSDALVQKLRSQLGKGFAHIAPQRMVYDDQSLLWRLDAKIAEYCLTGQAFKEGVVKWT